MSITSPETHAHDDGMTCPVCGDLDIEGGPFETDAGIAWQPMTCNKCGSTWNDTYVLTGYSELVDNRPAPLSWSELWEFCDAVLMATSHQRSRLAFQMATVYKERMDK